jgi:antitoxin component YwqK of YwqJK toxin-antitoxin module
MKFLKSLSILFLFTTILVSAQDINQFDSNGKRHGVWKKNFEGTNVLRYEGAFNHGQEQGLFKFYKIIDKKPVLAATRNFTNDNDLAEVKFFNDKGKVISEGKMDAKVYVGTWKYYQDKSGKLLTLEYYDNEGNLHGERIVYYDNGQIAEKQNYKRGKLHGVSTWYSENNLVLKEFNYVNGDLNGSSKYYNPKGELITEGIYKNGKKDGVWKFYENGKLIEETDFSYVPKYIKKGDKYYKNPKKKPLN